MSKSSSQVNLQKFIYFFQCMYLICFTSAFMIKLLLFISFYQTKSLNIKYLKQITCVFVELFCPAQCKFSCVYCDEAWLNFSFNS